MEEKKVIIIPIDGRKNKVISWSEAMTMFNITSEELESIIDKGCPIRDFYLDEAFIKG